jgi:alcohol dehydrogenase class IV
MTVTSALNAMAHAAEALYATDRTPETTAMAIDGLKAFVDGLPKVLHDPSDLAAREATQRGAWACGTVLGQVGMALHHKLCHTLGGSFDLPHAETHAIILPHAIAYNARAVAKELQPICDLLGGDNAGTALHGFAKSMNAPTALRDLGVTEADLDLAADLATTKPYPNPQPVTRDDIRALLQAAWAGDTPIE